jgi:hypothetical protein
LETTPGTKIRIHRQAVTTVVEKPASAVAAKTAVAKPAAKKPVATKPSTK